MLRGKRKPVLKEKRTCLANHKITQIFTRKYEDVKHKM